MPQTFSNPGDGNYSLHKHKSKLRLPIERSNEKFTFRKNGNGGDAINGLIISSMSKEKI